MFKKRLKDARRFQKIRLACFIGIYFSVISGFLGAIVALLGNVSWLENAIAAIGTIAASMTIIFLAGVFVTTRALSYIEIDLYYYSDESRQARRGEVPIKHSVARIPEENRAEQLQNGDESAPGRRGRVYTKPPLSSYRP